MKAHLMTPFVLLVLLGLSGAALADEPAVDPELRARVTAYWDAVVARDWATAFRLERGTLDEPPLDPFKYYDERRGRETVRGYEIDALVQEGERATATVFAANLMSLGARTITIPRFYASRWERVDGAWYHVETSIAEPPTVDGEGDAPGETEAPPPTDEPDAAGSKP